MPAPFGPVLVPAARRLLQADVPNSCTGRMAFSCPTRCLHLMWARGCFA